LGELKDRDAVEGLHHSRSWYYVLRELEQGRVPVIAALHGAVVGGGLELAAACHLRVADESAFFALPEGSRGIFVGGGGSVRLPKLIGAHRMLDMMLTGRVYNAADGLAKALELAERVATNAPMTNYALIHGLPRIAEQPADHGFLTESMLAALAQSAPEAKARVRAFLDGSGPKVKVQSKP
jgi:enoyl-CoA hydratase/carnithine racemase